MAYSVIIPEKIMATDIGSLNMSVVSGSNLENGNVFYPDAISGSTGYGEVMHVIAPSTGSLSGLWMAYSPEVVVIQAGGANYKGINQDPRNFINYSGSIVDAFKPQPGDIVLMSVDAFSGARGSNTYASSYADNFDLAWGATGSAGMTWQYLATDYITIGSGSSIGDTRLVAYRMRCLAN